MFNHGGNYWLTGGSHGSLLHEMQSEARYAERRADHNEKRSACDTGQMPSVRYEDV